ncbi:MAG: glycosyltransferase [Alphaproteobacteria bacterium]|nr:MAG: glycosyltransferase [Alphaproteobacteria bacterium]
MNPTAAQPQAHAPRKRIAFVINSLGPGGAERVMNTILHSASPDEWDVHLVLLDREQEHRLPPAFVKVHRLDCGMKLIASIRRLTRALEDIKPDLIVSFLVRANVASIFAGRRLKTPVIISERANLSAHLAGRYAGAKRSVAAMSSRLAYSRANFVIACSEGVKRDLIENFGVSAGRVEAIPNPFDLDQIVSDARGEPGLRLPDRFMVSVGRLVESKGFGDLIEAYAAANLDMPLLILGEGPDRGLIENKVRVLELEGRVQLSGYVRNPFAVLARAEFYVSASHCEGFPNSLAEAMAVGLPVISTDCPSGPAEILAEVETTGTAIAFAAQYGVLVPVRDVAAIAEALRMMRDASFRAHYSAMSKERMRDFGLRTIAGRYWAAFRRMSSQSNRLTATRARAQHDHQPQA